MPFYPYQLQRFDIFLFFFFHELLTVILDSIKLLFYDFPPFRQSKELN
jgi:hypothetical protein